MNILANDKEIWNKIKDLFKNLSNKRFDNEPIYNNEYIRTKIRPYNKSFHSNKKHIKDKYYDNSILLIESTCDAKNKYYPQIFLEGLFKKRNDMCNNLFKQIVQTADESDDESYDN